MVGGVRSPAWLGLWSASDLMLIGYPKGNSSNNRSCEMHRAVIGMVLRNPARTQGPGPPLGCVELGDGRRHLLGGQTCTFQKPCAGSFKRVGKHFPARSFPDYLLLKCGVVHLSKNFHFCLKQSKFRKEVSSFWLLLGGELLLRLAGSSMRFYF